MRRKSIFGLLFSMVIGGAGMMLPATAQTLDQSLQQAISNNPALESQRQQVLIAAEQITAAQAERRPDVSLSAGYGYQSVDTNRPFGFGVGDQSVGNAALEASIPLYTGGQIESGIDQAKAGRSSAEAAFETALQQLTLDVITAYLTVLTDREALKIRGTSVTLLENQVQASLDRFEAGVVTRTDVALSEARLEGGRAALAGAEAALESSMATYGFLVGQQPGALAMPDQLVGIPDTFELASGIADAENPQIQSLIFAERAAEEAVDVAAGSLKPSVALVGTATVQETFTDNFRDTNVTALVQGSVPLFERGVVKSQVRQAKLQQQAARLDLDNARRRVRAATAQAWYGRLAAEQAILASERQVEAAEIAFEGAEQELRVGTRTTLDVLDQEQQLLDARLGLVEAQRDYFIASASLLNAMGRLNLASEGF